MSFLHRAHRRSIPCVTCFLFQPFEDVWPFLTLVIILSSGAFQFKIYFVFDFYIANRSKQIFIMHVCLLIVFKFSRSDRRRNKILNVYSFRLPSFIPHMYVHRCVVFSRVSQISWASLSFCLMFIHMYT